MKKIRLLMVDDHRMFLQGMRMLIDMEPDIDVVGECMNGYDGVEAVLRLIASGYSNKEIGAALCFSEKTIKNYITVIFQKLQLTDRTQAAVYAVQHGLVERPGSAPAPSELGLAG